MVAPFDNERPKKYRASVFDRLIDEEAGSNRPERPPFRVQTKPQYARSIIRDLGYLFNTRTTKRFDVGPVAGPRTVLDYGIDDYTHLSPANWEDRNLIARHFRSAIEAYEPRLKINDVIVEEVADKHRRLFIRFDALLLGGDMSEPVSFGITVDQSEGTVELGGR